MGRQGSTRQGALCWMEECPAGVGAQTPLAGAFSATQPFQQPLSLRNALYPSKAWALLAPNPYLPTPHT